MSAAKKAVVGRQEHVYAPTFGTSQVERIELTEAKLLKRLGANRIFGLRDDNFVSEREKRKNVVAPLQIRVPSDFDFKDATADPTWPGNLARL